MALIVSRIGLTILDDACRKRGWKRQGKPLYTEAKVSLATVKNFWAEKPVGRECFQNICYAIGVDWRDVIDRHKSSQCDFAPIKSWEGVPNLPPVYSTLR